MSDFNDQEGESRVISGNEMQGDFDVSLRPSTLGEFIGQRKVCDNLKVFIEAAKARGKALDHVLFFGPPGLGKRHLRKLLARNLRVNLRGTAGR